MILLEVCVWGGCNYWVFELFSFWFRRKGRGNGWSLLFGIDDVYEFGFERSIIYKEVIYIRLVC